MANAVHSGGSDLVKKVQTVHKIRVDGIYGPVTKSKVVAFQKSRGIPATGVLDSATVYQYKKSWPALFGANSSPGSSSPTTNNGQVVDPMKPGGLLEMVIKTVLLYGMFKVLMKVF